MKTLTKVITIALTTVALSSPVSADWWTGWGNKSAERTKKLAEAKVTEAKVAEAKAAEAKAVEAKAAEAKVAEAKAAEAKAAEAKAAEAKVEEVKTEEVKTEEVKTEVADMNAVVNNISAPQENTGNGTPDVEIATLFKQLMDNNPNIEISAVQKPGISERQNNSADSVTYKISGKADRGTIKKLVALIKNNETIEIVPVQQARLNNNFRFQQNYQQPRGYNYQQPRDYNYQPPVFIQSDGTRYIWYPAPMLVQPQR